MGRPRLRPLFPGVAFGFVIVLASLVLIASGPFGRWHWVPYWTAAGSELVAIVTLAALLATRRIELGRTALGFLAGAVAATLLFAGALYWAMTHLLL